MIPSTKKIKYLNNRDLLAEIHRSKCSFSSFTKQEYHQYDLILSNIDRINIRTIAEAKRNRAKRIGLQIFNQARAEGDKKIKLTDCIPEHKTIAKTDLVFRIMTYEHIPLAPGRKKTTKTTADSHEKVNFPPFQHWKFNDEDELVCVGKSHWQGGVKTGKFNKDHGRITENLGRMFIKLSERYAQRSNWRGYCVDSETQALTKRGWLGIHEINETDTILSFNGTTLVWSSIGSIYRGEFSGKMHQLSMQGFDSLITPNHKILTSEGLVPVELLKESHKVILMGEKIVETQTYYDDNLVELLAWIATEGCYQFDKSGNLRDITVYQNPGIKADRIRQCLTNLGYNFSECLRKNNINFRIWKEDSRKIYSILPDKHNFWPLVVNLSTDQRSLFLNTLIDGDGWRTGFNRQHLRYVQKNKTHIDSMQALCALLGLRSNVHFHEHQSFGKPSQYFTLNIFSPRKNTTNGACINMHGGKNNGRNNKIQLGLGKINHPNFPTKEYHGQVWCPETEYGCFIARRNNTVYITGNTYVDEMRGQAILQLSQIGLQFDESKSENPFAYFTAAVTNSFTRILNIEKKNQNIRDDILEDHGLTPSMTRQHAHEYAEEIARQAEIYKNIRLPKSNEEEGEDEEANT